MKRIIEMSGNDFYHRDEYLGYATFKIRHTFKLKNGETYQITITEGSQYVFKSHSSRTSSSSRFYGITALEGNSHCGIICKKEFNELFFTPDPNKKYDITVKKVKK